MVDLDRHRVIDLLPDRTASTGAGWLERYSGVALVARDRSTPAIATFALGLDADTASVRSALTEPWSSGQAGGQVNRLKLIERQCYGQAGFALLQRRIVLAA